MDTFLKWTLGVAAILILDRLLLAAEARGWINYRRRGLSMGAAGYHAGQLASIFTPGVGRLHDASVEEAREETEDPGAPPVDLEENPGTAGTNETPGGQDGSFSSGPSGNGR